MVLIAHTNENIFPSHPLDIDLLLYKFAALKYFLEQPDNLRIVILQTTSARRRKPSSDTKYVPPPSTGREEDISDNDNYPEEFKQKLKGGVSKVKFHDYKNCIKVVCNGNAIR
jgi:hypothetical protein